ILDGFPLRPAPAWSGVLLLLAAAVIPGLLAFRLAAIYVGAGSLLLLALLLVGVQLAFDGGWIVSLVYPALGLVLAGGGSIAVDALMTRREVQTLSAALERLARRITPGQVISDYRIEKPVGR